MTYKIVDGNAGSNFFLAPVEGLLYLNGLIPRRTIEKAIYASETAAANAASISTSLLKKSVVDGTEGVKDDSSEVPAYPTYVLKLEACDAGTPKQCSYFPNLQIQVKMIAEYISVCWDRLYILYYLEKWMCSYGTISKEVGRISQ